MQTVTFPCMHCGKTMAVATDMQGKQVRCPHCRQVVQAPAPPQAVPAPVAAPEPTEPVFRVPAPGESESIFHQNEEHGDDLFGRSSQAPTLEMPPAEGNWPNMQIEGGAAAAPSAGETADSTGVPSVVPVSPEQEGGASPEEDTAAYPPAGDWQASEGAAPGVEEEAASVPRSREKPAGPGRLAGMGTGMMIGLFILIFLLPYAILMSVLAFYFYRQAQKIPQGLEAIPDFPSDTAPASHSPGAAYKPVVNTIMKRVSPDSDLTPRLKASLHQPLQIGDLEVTPEKVEQRRVVFRYETNDGSQESSQDALVMTLHLRNTSSDVYLTPLDRAYVRRWKLKEKGDVETNKPYMFLQVGAKGGKRFYGGACRREEQDREYIQGQDLQRVLKPGEEMTNLVCTDPENLEIVQHVQNNSGPLTWRVQLRRGLVKVRDREISATAVIGVEFDSKDIVQQ